jgi:cytochrome c oxidase subunit 1
MPHLATAGLLIFGAAGVAAGYLGVPRRVLSAAYDGAAPALWGTLMSVVGAGATLMSAALAVYLYALARNLLPAGSRASEALPEVRWDGALPAAGRAWTGPLAVLVLLALTVGFTAIAFETLRGLPLTAAGSVGH